MQMHHLTSVLASFQDRECTTSADQPGVYLTTGGACVPYDYGSNSCLQHDYIHDPVCQVNPSEAEIPPYCLQSWCYVDVNTCKKNSEEMINESEYFANEGDIFYSYSTCNATNYLSQGFDPLSAAGGADIVSIVPDYLYPMLGKELPNGTLLYEPDDRQEEYFDDAIPFRGVYIDYINSLIGISKGDIQNMTYTHTSRFSLKEFPKSPFTAAVRDVENGIVDMAIGPFWITGERLKMTTFTVPLVSDKTVLVIPKPGKRKGLYYETQKVLQPFTIGLWLALIFITIVAALLSVWISDREMVARKHYGIKPFSNRKKGWRQRKGVYFRLLLDNFLQKSMFFFSAGIEQDVGASLPHKVLMFGFGFIILIAVSAYVANLAAFLTRSEISSSGIKTIQEVIDGNIPICGHPALEDEILSKWPTGRWLFPEDAFWGPNGMFEAYEKGECQFLAVGIEDTIMDRDVQAKMCRLNLVYTESLITENPIAFPIRPQLASAFSYWMYLGEKTHGITLESAKKNFLEENEIIAQCEVKLSDLSKEEEVNKFARVRVGNMVLPIMAFMVCASIAVVLQVIHEKKRKKGKTSSFGRQSTLDIFNVPMNIYSDSKKDDDDVWVMPRHEEVKDSQEFSSDPDGDVESRRDINIANSNDDSVPDHVEGAPQSAQVPPQSIYKGSKTIRNETVESRDSSESEARRINASSRIDELVQTGVIDEVLDCFDFLQEMKKLKKVK